MMRMRMKVLFILCICFVERNEVGMRMKIKYGFIPFERGENKNKKWEYFFLKKYLLFVFNAYHIFLSPLPPPPPLPLLVVVVTFFKITLLLLLFHHKQLFSSTATSHGGGVDFLFEDIVVVTILLLLSPLLLSHPPPPTPPPQSLPLFLLQPLLMKYFLITIPFHLTNQILKLSLWYYCCYYTTVTITTSFSSSSTTTTTITSIIFTTTTVDEINFLIIIPFHLTN